MKRFAFVGTIALSLLIGGTAQAVNVVWDGGNGLWSDANWNSGQTALLLLGTPRGLNVGNGEVGTDVIVNGGDILFKSEVLDDFRWQDDPNTDSGTLTITGGSTLEINTAPPGDSDGQWSQFNTKALNINNGTLTRTFTATDPAFPAITILSSGLFSFAGVAANDGIDTQINLSNGGLIDNAGILGFGWYTQNHLNAKVAMTINDGALDLHDAKNADFLGGLAGGLGNPELLFHYGWDPVNNVALTPDYSINFTGPGSITVDRSGITVVRADGYDTMNSINTYDQLSVITNKTYEDLWDLGLLQAHGFSGLDGKTFSDFFSVTGTTGTAGIGVLPLDPADDDYMLTSLVIPGDFEADLDVDSSDLTDPTNGWEARFGNGLGGGDFLDWQANFGTGVGPLSAAVVPEPTSGILLIMGISTLLYRRRVIG